ncbi:hypothetical protein BJ508DRAFT_317570 [Ascobolus immersus RN42]|uniref:LDB19 N-terminal domain-containing protein n=1 Tax=Ascobolus immersus RN42 TaxID=1160509 RepID=A0A3N4IF24_ASCIM|nr:hypothetical protein BJ508DRAFT_317570 [Ascobolus immersus RN42]
MKIESPPLVCYGPPKSSTGALLSALARLEILEPQQKVLSFDVSLVGEVSHKHSIVSSCPDCKTQTSVVHKWEIIKEKKTLDKGMHSYPISFLVPGSLPASNSNPLSSISYFLQGKAVLANGEVSTFKEPIKIARSILPPDHPRNSVRVFPPTNLSANIHLPSVVYPGGSFPVEVRLDGVVAANKKTRWRLRRVIWKIEEHTKAIATTCPKHKAKLGNGKGVLHEDARLVGSAELKSGWKSDFSTSDGRIEMELDCHIPVVHHAACDVETPSGVEVTHALILELIVAEESLPTAPVKYVTPTGAARVLRMQFRLCVTDRPGMGISWDEEQPPMYENIPESPPTYPDLEHHTQKIIRMLLARLELATFGLPSLSEDHIII